MKDKEKITREVTEYCASQNINFNVETEFTPMGYSLEKTIELIGGFYQKKTNADAEAAIEYISDWILKQLKEWVSDEIINKIINNGVRYGILVALISSFYEQHALQ